MKKGNLWTHVPQPTYYTYARRPYYVGGLLKNVLGHMPNKI